MSEPSRRGIRILAPGKSAMGAKIIMPDGTPLPNVTRVDVRMEVGKINTAVIWVSCVEADITVDGTEVNIKHKSEKEEA